LNATRPLPNLQDQIDLQLRFLDELVRELGAQAKVVLIGHSCVAPLLIDPD
jgi:hypothetical protein